MTLQAIETRVALPRLIGQRPVSLGRLISAASSPMRQIGDHLGLTLVHVNRVLRSLRERRIVSVDRHVVAIRDLARLQRLAGREIEASAAASWVIEIGRNPQMSDPETVARRQDLGDPAPVAGLPIGLVA